MRTYVVILLSLLVLPLVSCTRAAKESKATVSIELPQSAATASNMRLAHVAINVTGAGVNPAIVYTWDNNQNGGASTTTPEVFQVAEIPSGADRLFQVLAVYKNIDTSQMVFYYGDVTKSLEGSEIALDVAISQVGAGNVTSGRVSGRYFETSTTGPTSLIDVKYNPGNGKPPLIVDQGSIVNGWFSIFMLSGANLQYVLRNSGTMMWGQEMSLEAAALNPAENSGAYFDQRVRTFLPVHIRTQYQNNTQVYLPADAETYVWGYWGPGATGKKVCTSGLDSSPTPTKVKRYTDTNLSGATAFTVSHVTNYNEPIPTKAELTNKASPYTTIVVQGGANMSSSCGSFPDNAANQYENFQKVYLDLFDGNGGDSVAGFRGIYRGAVVSNGSPTFVTVSSGDPKVITGQTLPGVVDVFNKVRLFKRVTTTDYNMDTPNCHDLASKGFLPGSSADASIDSSGNFSLSSTISAAEGTAGVSAVVCPLDPAGNVAQMGVFIGKWMFSSGGGGGGSSGGPATQITATKNSSPMNLAPTYQCFDITVMMKDANGVQASPSTSPINFSISTTDPVSGVSYYNSYADCMNYVNALSPASLVMPANQSNMQLYLKSSTSSAGAGFVVTPASAGLTSVALNLNIVNGGNYVKLDFPQSMLAGLCYKSKAIYSYISGGAAYAGSNLTVNLTGSSSIGFYSDATCSTSTSSVVINSGYSEADLYVKVTSGTPIFASTAVSGILTADHSFIIGSGTSTVASTSMTGSVTVSTGGCSGPYEVTLQNASGTTVPASSTKSITLISTLATTFYSDSGCTSSTSTVSIPSGAYKNQVWAKFNAAGINSLSGTSSGLTANSYPVTVNGLQKFDLVVEGAATSGTHAQCIRLEIQPMNYPSSPGSFPYDPVTINFVNFPANSLFKNRINGECVGALGGTSIAMPSYAPTPQYVYFLAMNTTVGSVNLASSNLHLEATNYANGTALNFTIGAPPAAALAEASGNAAVEFGFYIMDILERFTGIPTFVTSYFNGSSWVTASQATLSNGVAMTARVTDGTNTQLNYTVTGRQASWTASFVSGTMPNYFSIVRPSQGYQVLSDGYLSLAASHVPRWDRDPDPAGSHNIRGLLVEGPTTNLLGSGNISEDITLWDINPGGNGYAQVTRDNSISILDLTGTNNPMWRLMDTNGGNGSNVERANIIFTNDIPDNQDFVASVFIKKDTSRYAGLMLQSNGGMSGGVVVDLDNGTTAPMTGPYTPQEVLASGAEKFNNGWYRVWVKFNSHVGTHGMFYLFPAFCDTNATSICQNGLISATGNVFVWGGQVEQSSSLTSYIPTSIGTRASEDLTIPLSNITSFTATEGTFRAEFASAGSSYGKSILHIGDSSNAIDMFGDVNNGKVSGLVMAGSTAQGAAQSALPFAPNGSPNIASFSYATGANVKLNIGVNGLGSTSGNVTSITAPTLSGLSLQVGGINAQPASYMNGSIKALHYWPYAFGVPGVMSSSK